MQVAKLACRSPRKLQAARCRRATGSNRSGLKSLQSSPQYFLPQLRPDYRMHCTLVSTVPFSHMSHVSYPTCQPSARRLNEMPMMCMASGLEAHSRQPRASDNPQARAIQELPRPLWPPGSKVYSPHCTGCVSPRCATSQAHGTLLLKALGPGASGNKCPLADCACTGAHKRRVSRTTMSMYFKRLHMSSTSTSCREQTAAKVTASSPRRSGVCPCHHQKLGAAR